MIKDINTNQLGFMTNARKTCVVRTKGIDNSFVVIDENDTVVFSGMLTGPVKAQHADEEVMQGDFSDIKLPGTYKIKVSNGETSHPFVIGDDVYDDILKDSLVMLTKQRCGVEVTADIAGSAAHPACHNTPALIYGTDKYKEVNGGWHDAGDYGRYIVAGATTIADLLMAYEEHPDMWSADDLGIPESGNGMPDILDEAKFELDWMLKMQDEESGGVYHKVTCRTFPGFVMPEEETEELVLSPISIAATADFAAIMAKASTIYREHVPEFANQAIEAAKKAYAYLELHKGDPTFKNPEDIRTGEYRDAIIDDEVYWAAVELYKVTKDIKYKEAFEASLVKGISHGFGWDDMGSYGNTAYLSLDREEQNPELLDKLKEAIITKADEYLNNCKTDGYMVDLGSNYCWGSNLIVCSYAREMLLAAQLTGRQEYKDAAYDQITYLLGQNATGYCFVTGFGAVPPVNPHHRPSAAAGSPVSGMVVGGPNGGLQDAYVKKTMVGVPPAKLYADHLDSYSTNEITIYWNSPFTYLLTAIMADNR